MIRQRVLIDIEFAIDEAHFTLAHLAGNVCGISAVAEANVRQAVTEAGVREAVAERLIRANWADHGLEPQRSVITTRSLTSGGDFVEVVLPADPGVTAY